jgi:hypothetical protein
VTFNDGSTEKIVPMDKYLRAMSFAPLAEVRAYWEGLRAGRPIPLRSEVDPRGIERALEYAFVLERVAPQIARFRLAGMHLNDLMGMEVRGMPLTSFFAPESRVRVSQALEEVFEGPSLLELRMVAETGIGRPSVEARAVILPLKSDLGDISRALGCLVSEGQIGRTPRRFEVQEVIRTPIGGDAAAAPTTGVSRPAFPVQKPVYRNEFDSPAPPAFLQSAPKSRAHLRLVKTDRAD